jgi:hypothetical protein
MEIKEKPPDDFFKGIKTSLKSVLKHPDINLPKITNAVIKCNKIVIQTLMFMKLFLLDHYDKNNTLPIINDEFINSCMKILCNEKSSGRPGIGSVIYNNDVEIWASHKYIGVNKTNNEAEYSALLFGLEKALELEITPLHI